MDASARMGKPRGAAERFARGRRERPAERARSPLALYSSEETTESLLGRRASRRTGRLPQARWLALSEWRGWFETAASTVRECAGSPARLALLVLFLLLCLLCLQARSMVASRAAAVSTAGAVAATPARRRFCLVLDAAALASADEGVAHIRLLAALSMLAGAQLHVLQASRHPTEVSVRARLPAPLAAGVVWHSLPLSPHLYEASAAVAVSFCAYSWLADRPKAEGFGLIAFHGGSGYYSLLARGQALNLHRARIVVLMPALAREAWG
eukprot:scaffold4178_cov101-Isochrysis_galbana.AAC.3